MLFDWVAQGKVLANLVPISTTRAYPPNIASLFKLPENALNRAFRNSDPVGNIANARFWSVYNADQHMGVIREECPFTVPHYASVARLR